MTSRPSRAARAETECSECTLLWERPGGTPSRDSLVADGSSSVIRGPHRSPACSPVKLQPFSFWNLGCKLAWEPGSGPLDPLEPTTRGTHARGPRVRPSLENEVQARRTLGGVEPSVPEGAQRTRVSEQLQTTRTSSGTLRSRPQGPQAPPPT